MTFIIPFGTGDIYQIEPYKGNDKTAHRTTLKTKGKLYLLQKVCQNITPIAPLMLLDFYQKLPFVCLLLRSQKLPNTF